MLYSLYFFSLAYCAFCNYLQRPQICKCQLPDGFDNFYLYFWHEMFCLFFFNWLNQSGLHLSNSVLLRISWHWNSFQANVLFKKIICLGTSTIIWVGKWNSPQELFVFCNIICIFVSSIYWSLLSVPLSFFFSDYWWELWRTVVLDNYLVWCNLLLPFFFLSFCCRSYMNLRRKLS